MPLFRKLETKAKALKKTIILPESYDPRVQKAADYIIRRKIAHVVLIQSAGRIRLKESANLTIIDSRFSAQFAGEYQRLRKKTDKKYTMEQAVIEVSDPLVFACMLLRNKFADAVVAGSVYSTGAVIRNAIKLIGTAKNNKTVSSFFLMTFPRAHAHRGKVLAYADCGVMPNPDKNQLSDIAVQTSLNFTKLTGIQPRTAFLSFSTKGSARDESTDKVIAAYKLTKKRMPRLVLDGELQFDAAFVPHVAERKNPKGKIMGNANVFIFPDLNSGNIAYKITERIGGAVATGPIVQGLAKPVMDLSRGCNANDVINMVTVAALL